MARFPNLVWIDAEMTGINPDTNTLLEIALVITDSDLNILFDGTTVTIHQSDETLAAMDDWNQEHHSQSGLIKAVKESTTTMEQAEQKLLDIIKQYCEPEKSFLAGNSIHQDRAFLRKYMPTLTEYLNHQLLDVSSIKIIKKAWYPEIPFYKKSDLHNALEDIYESIYELEHYRKFLFVPQKPPEL